MKKVKIYIVIASAVFITSCLKDKPNVDFSNITPIAEISSSNINPTKNGPSSGLDYFNQATLPYIGADSAFDVTFNVNIASEYPLNKNVTVTVAVDDAKRAAYNGNLAPADQFLLPADSNYSFPVKTAVIKAGTRLATFTVTFYPQTLNPSKSYMLPITLTDASGVTISGNLSTIYLHIIGNPLAGVYKWDFTRYNDATATGTPVTATVGDDATFVPDDATTIEVGSNYAAGYVLKFTNNGGVFSDFKVSFSKATLDDLTASGIVVTSGPTIVTADPVNKIFQFTYSVTNSTGAPRLLIDKYYK